MKNNKQLGIGCLILLLFYTVVQSTALNNNYTYSTAFLDKMGIVIHNKPRACLIATLLTVPVLWVIINKYLRGCPR